MEPDVSLNAWVWLAGSALLAAAAVSLISVRLGRASVASTGGVLLESDVAAARYAMWGSATFVAVLSAIDGGLGQTTAWTVTAVSFFAALQIFMAWQLLTARSKFVLIDERGLTISQSLNQRFVPWDDIVDATVRPHGIVQINVDPSKHPHRGAPWMRDLMARLGLPAVSVSTLSLAGGYEGFREAFLQEIELQADG